MRKRTLVLALAAGLTLAGCGSSDSGGTDPAPAGQSSGAASGSAAGSGGGAQERKTVKVAIAAKLEAFAPLLVGMELGDYDKQGLDVEIVSAKNSDALVLLATGEVDAIFGAPSAAFFNAVSGGSEIKIVAPGMFPPKESQQGVWVNKELAPDGKFDPAKLKGQVIASAVGPGAPVSMVIEDQLKTAGVSMNDVTFQTMGATDILVALESGAVKAGWLSDPVWLEATKSDSLTYAFGQPSDMTVGAVLFGPNLLQKDKDKGQRVIDAMASTMRDHLQGKYHQDKQVRAALVKQLEIDDAQVDLLPELRFPPDLAYPSKLTDRLQTTFKGQDGVLTYTDPIPENKLIDRSFVDAIG